ncbi:MAG: ATP-binding cassette domain-containing protein [Brachybacterium sp.]|nr:ATP-binding cassette domain-containing protein [Brachybacterium sp.]
MNDPLLRVAHLSFSFRRREVLREVTFEGTTGFIVIHGPNGSGKSTLLNLVATVLSAPRETIFIAGQDIARPSARNKARRTLGYLPQTTDSTSFLRVTEWLEYGAWLRDIPSRGRRDHVAHALDTWALRPLAEQRMRALSVGQRRRVDLARACLGRPDLLVLDEPLAALDSNHRALVEENLTLLSRQALILISDPAHDWTGVQSVELDPLS